MITKESDENFKFWLDRMEENYVVLSADPHYRPIIEREDMLGFLHELRSEWRERQERARARQLRADASAAEG